MLDQYGVAVRAGQHCASYALAQLGVELQTLETFGKENIRSMVKDVLAYDQALETAMKAKE